MYFPVSGNEPESSTDREVVECHEVRGSETVLVVEDDESVRECSVEFLSSVGYQVLAAASGEEAVAVAARHKGKIDLMLADVVMPGVNGAKLALSLTEIATQHESVIRFGSRRDRGTTEGCRSGRTISRKALSIRTAGDNSKKDA
jgi:response regulator RpfG family c-di-GMP phosphodiesterase